MPRSLGSSQDELLSIRDVERFELIAAIGAVDYVVPLTEDTPVELLRAIRPQIHTKGTDYQLDQIPERGVVESFGGRVAIVGDEKSHSTTAMLEAIRTRTSSAGD